MLKPVRLTLQNAFLPDGEVRTLEELVVQYFAKASALRERISNVDMFSQMVFSAAEARPQNQGLYLRAYIIENHAMGMIDVESADARGDLLEALPPAGHKFLKREIVLYIIGNQVISYGMTRINGQFSRLLTDALVGLGVVQGAIRIEDTPRRTTLDELKRVGVRSIDLSITDYMESLPQARDLPEVLKAIFAAPMDPDEAVKRAKSVGRVKLSRGRVLKKEKIDFERDEYLTSIGERVFLSEGDDDYTITLENDRVLHPRNFKISKTYEVPKYANSVSFPHLKEALANFGRELTVQGLMP